MELIRGFFVALLARIRSTTLGRMSWMYWLVQVRRWEVVASCTLRDLGQMVDFSKLTWLAMENKSPILTGYTSSNCCFSIVMLVFHGCRGTKWFQECPEGRDDTPIEPDDDRIGTLNPLKYVWILTRWAPGSSYKWSYLAPISWPKINGLTVVIAPATGVIIPIVTSRNSPPCRVTSRNKPANKPFFELIQVWEIYMDVSENSATPKSSILIGFSIINYPFWGTPIFGRGVCCLF